MSLGDAATVFSVEHDAAASPHPHASPGRQPLVQLSPTGLPVILHWGADLGDLDGLSAPALLQLSGRRSRSAAVHDVLAGARSLCCLELARSLGRIARRPHIRSVLYRQPFAADQRDPGTARSDEVGADTVIVEARIWSTA